MYCIKCGKKLSSESRFCGACGTPVKAVAENTMTENPVLESQMPAESVVAAPVLENREDMPVIPKKKRDMKALALVLVLVLVLVVAGIWLFGKQNSGKQHTNGFDTPEEALDYFVEAVSRMDYEKALTAFPIERAAENYSFYAMTNRIQSWQPNLDMPVPEGADENIQLNQHFFAVTRERQINNFIFSFFADAELREGYPICEEYEIRRLFEDYNIEDIRNLRIEEEIEFTDPELQESESCQENFTKMARIYGGDTIEDYLVKYRIDNKVYVSGVQFIKYGGKYYIWNLYSFGLGNSYCYVTPEDEWGAEFSEDVPAEETATEAPTETEAPASADKLRVGWIVRDMTDEAQSYFCGIAEEKAEEMGFELIYYDQGGDGQRGIDAANELILQGVDAIIIDPCEPQAIVSSLTDAWNAGILVGLFSFERASENLSPDYIADEILDCTLGIFYGETVEAPDWLSFDGITKEDVDAFFQ